MRVRRVRRHDAATWRRGDVGLTSIDTGKNNWNNALVTILLRLFSDSFSFEW